MRFFNYDSRFAVTVNKIADAIILNLLWIAACLPVVTLGPACNALYETLHITIVRDESTVFRVFWQVYKRNIGSGILQTVLYELALLCGLILFLAGYMYFGQAAWIGGLYLVLLLYVFVVVGMAVYHFFVLRSTRLPFGQQFALAFVLALRHLPTTVLLVGMVLAVVLLAEWFLLLLLFLPAGLAWLAGRYLEKIAGKYPGLIRREVMDGEGAYL